MRAFALGLQGVLEVVALDNSMVMIHVQSCSFSQSIGTGAQVRSLVTDGNLRLGLPLEIVVSRLDVLFPRQSVPLSIENLLVAMMCLDVI